MGIYQEVTNNLIEKLKKYNITLSQLDELMDLYSQLPENDKWTLWGAEREIVELEKKIAKKREVSE